MKHLGWKILGIFSLIWLVWYFTGGPKRVDGVKPYVRYDYDTNTISKSEVDLETGAQEILPINTGKEINEVIKDNLENPSFTN